MIHPSNPARQTLSLSGPSVVSAPEARGEGLLAAGYRTADRLLRRLLLAHVFLLLALAPLHGTWRAALLIGVPIIGLGWFVAWRWEGRLVARLARAPKALARLRAGVRPPRVQDDVAAGAPDPDYGPVLTQAQALIQLYGQLGSRQRAKGQAVFVSLGAIATVQQAVLPSFRVDRIP